MEIIYDGNIIHRSKGRLHQNSPVEYLLAFLDDHAVAGELLTAEGGLDGIHFGIVDGDAALLHQPAGLALEAARPHFTSSVSTSIAPPPKSSLVSSVVGICSVSPSPENRARDAALAFSASSWP